jgi:hypothetical protein
MTTETAVAAPTKTVAPKSQVKRKTTESAQPKTAKVPTPKLVCQVTGVARYTNAAYLEKKASQRKCSVAEIISHYVSRDVAKLLRGGKTVAEIQGILGVTYDSPIAAIDGTTILRFNGKTKAEKND